MCLSVCIHVAAGRENQEGKAEGRDGEESTSRGGLHQCLSSVSDVALPGSSVALSLSPSPSSLTSFSLSSERAREKLTFDLARESLVPHDSFEFEEEETNE